MMKKIFLFGVLCACTAAQTFDINALRMAQSKIGTGSMGDSRTSNVTQSQAKVIVDTPIDPTKYIIGPGDQFRVNIISSDDISIYTLAVSPSGEVLITNVGIVSVNGITLAKSIQIIKSMILEANPTAKVHVILSEIRQFKVKVIGHLQKPGFYSVTPVSRVSDLYDNILLDLQSGSLETEKKQNVQQYPEMSRRNIVIQRDGENISVDLDKFGSTGLDEFNPFLMQEDAVIIPLKIHIVGIFGGIKIPGNYEFIQGETLSELVELAGGLRPDAVPNKIEITRFISSTEKVSILTSMAEADSIILAAEDHIMIRFEKDYKRQNIVYITGEVRYPGVYAIEPGKTKIGEALQKAGGFTASADQTKLIINNRSISRIPDREKNRILLIPDENRSPEEKAYIKARMLTKKGTIESSSVEQTQSLMDLPLVNKDQIIIPENFDYIEILGGVLKPGRYPYTTDLSYERYIELAGGLTETATRTKFIIKAGTGQRLPIKKDVQIENGDTLFIPEKMEFNKWIVLKDILTALGQVAALIVVIQNAIGI